MAVMQPQAHVCYRRHVWQRVMTCCPVSFKKNILQKRFLTKGPNWKWSLDGYDKLREFGFYIHGCLDEYSRYSTMLSNIYQLENLKAWKHVEKNQCHENF